MGRKRVVIISEEMYDRICRALVEYEEEEEYASSEMYEALVEIEKAYNEGETL